MRARGTCKIPKVREQSNAAGLPCRSLSYTRRAGLGHATVVKVPILPQRNSFPWRLPNTTRNLNTQGSSSHKKKRNLLTWPAKYIGFGGTFVCKLLKTRTAHHGAASVGVTATSLEGYRYCDTCDSPRCLQTSSRREFSTFYGIWSHERGQGLDLRNQIRGLPRSLDLSQFSTCTGTVLVQCRWYHMVSLSLLI